MPRLLRALASAALAVAPLALPDASPAQSARRERPGSATPGRLGGTWLGQDGHDFVGPNSALAPSDVQDIHIRLTGLPPNVEVKHAVIRGEGGDEWQYEGPYGPWKAQLVRRPGAATADLFFEPTRVETGRGFTITLTLDDGRTAELIVSGGQADPNLRMPGARLKAAWVGQDGRDRVGPGPAVGPDGVQDVVLTLENLSPKIEVKAVSIRTPDGAEWQSGVNRKGLPNAELIRRADDPSKAEVFLNPDRDRDGQALRVAVLYANDKIDRTSLRAGRSDPKLLVPAVRLPRLVFKRLDGRWEGQDGADRVGPGSVRVSLEGIPPGPVVGAALSDAVGGSWVFKARGDVVVDAATYPLPLDYRPGASPNQAEISFPPIRDESGSILTLRLLYADGRQVVARLPGGPADPALRAGPGPEPSSTPARPGDDLNDLANRFGTVRLAPGTYPLNRPLVLNRAVRLIGEPGATLEFTQPPGSAPWTAAIKVHAGRTTLEGFAVRFTGPVRWADEIHYGPAVIGTTDNHDNGQHSPKAGLIFRRLDLESPPPSTKWEEATRLMRLATAENGRIEENTLRGGMVEFLGGPWYIVGNRYHGTPPGTFNFGVFSGHRTHDLTLAGNTARDVGPSGKTWRFLVLTVSGSNDIIRENTIADVGPRDDDRVQDNAPEIILTEAYRLRFEGRPRILSPDGLVLAIPEPQGDPAEPGDAVAILEGPHAGRFRRVAQRIDRTTYLLDEPLPSDDAAVSIATGFLGERFESNSIEARRGTVAAGLVLVGNHFGTVVARNHVIGCGEALRLTAAPTEHPGPWGWSHAPAFGVIVEGNTFEEAARGATLAVEYGPPVKSSRGRVYLSATLTGNALKRSPALMVGDPRGTDPGELLLTAAENRTSRDRPGVLQVHAATLDGRPVRGQRFPLPVAEMGSR